LQDTLESIYKKGGFSPFFEFGRFYGLQLIIFSKNQM